MFDEITTFSFPTRIVFGRGATALPACLEETGVRKPLVVTDPGLRASPAFDAVSRSQGGGDSYEVFDRVHGNPVEEDVVRIGEQYSLRRLRRRHRAVGGGSAIDVAKAVGRDGPARGPSPNWKRRPEAWTA